MSMLLVITCFRHRILSIDLPHRIGNDAALFRPTECNVPAHDAALGIVSHLAEMRLAGRVFDADLHDLAEYESLTPLVRLGIGTRIHHFLLNCAVLIKWSCPPPRRTLTPKRRRAVALFEAWHFASTATVARRRRGDTGGGRRQLPAVNATNGGGLPGFWNQGNSADANPDHRVAHGDSCVIYCVMRCAVPDQDHAGRNSAIPASAGRSEADVTTRH